MLKILFSLFYMKNCKNTILSFLYIVKIDMKIRFDLQIHEFKYKEKYENQNNIIKINCIWRFSISVELSCSGWRCGNLASFSCNYIGGPLCGWFNRIISSDLIHDDVRVVVWQMGAFAVLIIVCKFWNIRNTYIKIIIFCDS